MCFGDEETEPTSDIIAMCGTCNSLDFKSKIDGFDGFTYTATTPAPITNTGRLVMLTTDPDKEQSSKWQGKNSSNLLSQKVDYNEEARNLLK